MVSGHDLFLARHWMLPPGRRCRTNRRYVLFQSSNGPTVRKDQTPSAQKRLAISPRSHKIGGFNIQPSIPPGGSANMAKAKTNLSTSIREYLTANRKAM